MPARLGHSGFLLWPFAPWQAWQTMALVAPVSALPAATAELPTITPKIVAARMQSRFMIACYPISVVNLRDRKLYTRVNNLRSSGGYVDLSQCEIPDECGGSASTGPRFRQRNCLRGTFELRKVDGHQRHHATRRFGAGQPHTGTYTAD